MSAPTGFPEDAYAVVEGWSALSATGPDAAKFLQNFCTNDVLRLADGESCEAMFCDAKAHVVAYGWVARRSDHGFTVLLGSDRAPELAEHLDRYLIREQVELSAQQLPPVTIGRQATGVALDAFGGGVRAEWETPAPAAGGGGWLTPDDFERLRLRLGAPLDGVDVDARNLPQEVDRNTRAISFTKGCYLGQEPVARIDALGRVNRLLRGVEVTGAAPTAGAELLADDKPVGRVTSSVATDGGAIALAYVRREHAADQTAVAVEGSPATVRTLPFGSGD